MMVKFGSKLLMPNTGLKVLTSFPALIMECLPFGKAYCGLPKLPKLGTLGKLVMVGVPDSGKTSGLAPPL